MKAADIRLTGEALANFRGRFYLLVDQSDGCWLWKGPVHSSGAGRYKWRTEDGGEGKYVLSHRVSYWLATGHLPRHLRNLCGKALCVKPSHFWAKPAGSWKATPRKAKRGRLRQLPDSEIRRIRLLATLSNDEDEIGKQFGLTRRQVADIALGRVRPEAGGRIRSSRFRGIRFYHQEFEQELLSLRPDEPLVVAIPVDLGPHVDRTPSDRPTQFAAPPARPFPFRSYGQVRRRLPRPGRY